MCDLYFNRETTDTYGVGVFVLGSFTGSAVGIWSTSFGLHGETPLAGTGHEFHFDDFCRDAADEIGASQLTGALLVGTQPT
jgi:hypothetical protein